VYHTEAGWIIAYTEAHADDAAREVLESSSESERELQQETLFDAINEH